MNNYVQKGDTITLTAPAAGFTSGTPVMVGGMLVVPKKTAASGATAACVFVGVFEIAKTAGEAWTAGQVLYWNRGLLGHHRQRAPRSVERAQAGGLDGQHDGR